MRSRITGAGRAVHDQDDRASGAGLPSAALPGDALAALLRRPFGRRRGPGDGHDEPLRREADSQLPQARSGDLQEHHGGEEVMIERHYDEDALVTMLDARVIDSDPHLAACGECAERLEDFRMVTAALRDAATWDQREVTTAPNPNTIATLRAFADTMAAEDAAAEGYLAELLAGPRETWMANLTAHPEWRTAGVVRG